MWVHFEGSSADTHLWVMTSGTQMMLIVCLRMSEFPKWPAVSYCTQDSSFFLKYKCRSKWPNTRSNYCPPCLILQEVGNTLDRISSDRTKVSFPGSNTNWLNDLGDVTSTLWVLLVRRCIWQSLPHRLQERVKWGRDESLGQSMQPCMHLSILSSLSPSPAPFLPSFHICTEHQLCARYYSRPWDYSSEQNKITALTVFVF